MDNDKVISRQAWKTAYIIMSIISGLILAKLSYQKLTLHQKLTLQQEIIQLKKNCK